MPSLQAGHAPDLHVFLKSLKNATLDSSIENLISLLKRRQILDSRSCAKATAHLLLRVVAKFRWTDIGKLLARILEVGKRLVEAQPREMVVGNIVRRVLGMIRDEAKENRVDGFCDFLPLSYLNTPRLEPSDPAERRNEATSKTNIPLCFGSSANQDLSGPKDEEIGDSRIQESQRTHRLMLSHASHSSLNGIVVQQSMFNLLSATNSPTTTPPCANSLHKSAVSASSLARRIAMTTKDLKAEIISGIEEIIDELGQVDDQVAAYAQEHIHSNEVVLTNSSSLSVQKFLLKAAEKRKFTVIVTESYPNDHNAIHSTVMGKYRLHDGIEEEMGTESFLKPLSAAGVTVILMTDASIFAIMSRVNKVILATHAVIANGGLIAAAGTRIIAKAAKVHRTPVIVVSGIYKLSPEYPYEFESLIEYGDPRNVIPYEDGVLVEELEVDNPVYDYVPPDLVDLYITNLGAHAPSYLYRIVADHYKPEDINFNKPELQL
ncbi:hypothetical protein K3495_g1490 [Podosphaera aphanis]|nr:hypothetical protein K3495_g1490 [Podosphaera aphanis]